MNIIITGKNFTPSKANKDFVEKKITMLSRYDKKIYQAKIELDADKKERDNTKFRVEIWLDGEIHIQAGSRGQDFYTTVESTIQKLKTQLMKHKKKLEGKKS